MPVYLVIRKSDGIVENAIKWDGENDYDPGEAYDLELVSGEPGCPWIDWTRQEDGSFVPPPEQIYVRCAVFRKNNGEVVGFKMFKEKELIFLPEPAAFEYGIFECPDNSVVEGWSFINGEFVEPS